MTVITERINFTVYSGDSLRIKWNKSHEAKKIRKYDFILIIKILLTEFYGIVKL